MKHHDSISPIASSLQALKHIQGVLVLDLQLLFLYPMSDGCQSTNQGIRQSPSQRRDNHPGKSLALGENPFNNRSSWQESCQGGNRAHTCVKTDHGMAAVHGS